MNFLAYLNVTVKYLVAQTIKNLPAMQQRYRFDPWVRKVVCRRKWLPSPVFLPGELLGQKSLGDYSPWGRKELDMAAIFYKFKWHIIYKNYASHVTHLKLILYCKSAIVQF